MKIHGRFRATKQAARRIFARALGNYFTTDDKNLKNQENRERMVGTKRGGEKKGRETSGKSGKMAKKEMKIKRARWPARRYKKDDERKGLIPRNVI